MRRILFIVPLYKGRSPSQRFRFEQYIDYFEENNYSCIISSLVTAKSDKLFYSKGKFLRKLLLLIGFIFIRLNDIRIAKKFDLVFIQREAFFLGTTFFEKQLAKRAKIIFDFDDSIWLNNVSDANKNLNFLKKPSKTARIIKLSHMIFAGNQYLANYASQFSTNFKIIPTTIDTSYHKKNKLQKSDQICIGWTGTSTTLEYFNIILQALKEVYKNYHKKVYFKVIVDTDYVEPDLNLISAKWKLDTEIDDLSEIDIGIMPLPDDEWAKGKCGLKGLQYMALEIPTIMSPVGVNTEIIQDGINGFLASTDEEWTDKLSLLIDSLELRKKIGAAGRKTVLEKYSFESQKDNYLKYFSELLEN
ncbi:glycosyltransferase family 4 protein [Bacteroidota bacterium]